MNPEHLSPVPGSLASYLELVADKAAQNALDRALPHLREELTPLRELSVRQALDHAMVQLREELAPLRELPQQMARQEQAFEDFRKRLEGNGQPGLCKTHEDDLNALKKDSDRSFGRREVLTVIVALVLSGAMQLSIAILNSERNKAASPTSSAVTMPHARDAVIGPVGPRN